MATPWVRFLLTTLYVETSNDRQATEASLTQTFLQVPMKYFVTDVEIFAVAVCNSSNIPIPIPITINVFFFFHRFINQKNCEIQIFHFLMIELISFLLSWIVCATSFYFMNILLLYLTSNFFSYFFKFNIFSRWQKFQ